MSNLAETILRDVPRVQAFGGNVLSEDYVLAALTAAMDLAIAERVGEVLSRLRKADEYEPLGHDGWDAADLITALLARIAAMEAQIKGLEGGIEAACDREAETERELRTALAASETRAEAAEAKVEKLRGALEWIEALDDHAECCGKEYTECCGQPEYGLDRAKRVARNARAALSTTEASHDPQA